MSIESGFLYGLVFGQNRPLCEYSVITGNHTEIALRVIKSMNRNNKNAFADHGDYVFTLKLNDQGYIFLCLATRDVDLQSQNVFLDKLESLWMDKIAPYINDYSPYSQNSAFSSDIASLISECNVDYFTQLSPKEIDRKMANIHTSLVYSDELSIKLKTEKSNISKQKMILKLKRWKNKILYNRKYLLLTIALLVIFSIPLVFYFFHSG